MNRWNSFLNSLATAGGNLALLYSLVVFLLIADIVQVCKHGISNGDISSFAKDGFIALIAILSGRNHPEPPSVPGSITTQTTLTATDSTKEVTKNGILS